MSFNGKIIRRSGFSLVELLAVVAIIGIMAAIIGVSLKPNEGSSLRAAQSAATGVFQAARTVASMRRTEARVIIYAGGDGADQEAKYLRYMGVVYWDEENSEWVGANSGVYLPAGTYYIPDGAVGSMVTKGDAVSGPIMESEDAPKESIAYPVSSGDKDTWYYYSFDSSGSARSDTGQSFAGLTFVVASGRPGPPSGDTPNIVIENEFSTAGFVIRRIGGVLPLSDYDQIKTALSN
ncbi:hypothetical protein GCM10007047_15440 [Cerasicoccus arenae]|uniref:Prepilin-type N-terminal cleavage/methylation domain-containing protein n=2 Tax=Cerasicoccus arenae TaxID=424488 RepID=A0A8J3GCP1_9BACT|nr:hypothetical protein GCM10007047_15440 [Cerasicoccus arenae]